MRVFGNDAADKLTQDPVAFAVQDFQMVVAVEHGIVQKLAHAGIGLVHPHTPNVSIGLESGPALVDASHADRGFLLALVLLPRLGP